MAYKTEKKISHVIPEEGATVMASPGNKFTRIHLDLAEDGITLAMVGAGIASSQNNARHSLTLKKTDDGITLAMVGAASTAG